MSYKGIGAVLIIAGCGGFGLSLAAGCRREEALLRQLIRVLQAMRWELQYRLTPLPELCRQAAGESGGVLREVFSRLSRELDAQNVPEVSACMAAVLRGSGDLPASLKKLLRQLGRSLGRYDLNGQLQGLAAVESACREQMKALNQNKEVRLRSYQTLALCAGAALVILLV